MNSSSFEFNLFTHLYFGKDVEKAAAKCVRDLNGKKTMLVYGMNSIKKSGLYETITGQFRNAGMPYVEWGSVRSNPYLSYAYEGILKARAENVDFVIGIGGASAIDTAKAIALGLRYDVDSRGLWKFFTGEEIPTEMAPVGAIPTLASAGSEMSGACVLVDDELTQAKKGPNYPNVMRPVFALVNPELTYSVPARLTAIGAADTFSHTMERYFAEQDCDLSDEFAFGLLRSVVRHAITAVKEPFNYTARAELSLAACFGHCDITGLGGKPCACGIHALEANLSGMYNSSHGAGIALIMPVWLKELAERGNEKQREKALRFVSQVFGVSIDGSDPRDLILQGALRMKSWLDSLGLPSKLFDIGIAPTEIDNIVQNCRCDAAGILHAYLDFDKRDVQRLFISFT